MISAATYIKSSYSDAGNCVEVRLLPDGTVGVRDSKNPATPPLVFTRPEWSAFLAGVHAHEFELPTGSA